MYGMRVAEYSSVLIKLAKKRVRIALPYVRYRMGSHSHVGTVWCFYRKIRTGFDISCCGGIIMNIHLIFIGFYPTYVFIFKNRK